MRSKGHSVLSVSSLLSLSLFCVYLLNALTDSNFVTPTVFITEPHLFLLVQYSSPGYTHVGLKCHGNIPKQPQAKSLQKQQGGNDKTQSTNYSCSTGKVFNLIQCFFTEIQEYHREEWKLFRVKSHSRGMQKSQELYSVQLEMFSLFFWFRGCILEAAEFEKFECVFSAL